MTEKTKPDLFNTALAQLEEIVAELESCDDSDDSLTDFELDIINRESGVDLTGFQNPESINITVPPKNKPLEFFTDE